VPRLLGAERGFVIYKTTFRKLSLFSTSGQKRLVVSNGTVKIGSSQLSHLQTKTIPVLETLRRKVLTTAGSVPKSGLSLHSC